jgi:thymidylate kinase
MGFIEICEKEIRLNMVSEFIKQLDKLSFASTYKRIEDEASGINIDIVGVSVDKETKELAVSLTFDNNFKEIKKPNLLKGSKCFIGYEPSDYKKSVILVCISEFKAQSLEKIASNFFKHIKNKAGKLSPVISVKRKNTFVVLLGVDGSGKSTQLEQLLSVKYMQLTGVQYFYGGNNLYWIPGLNKIKENQKDGKRINPILKFFAGYLCIFDRRIRVLMALYSKFLGNNIIFDRYFYDDMIFFERIKITKQKVSKVRLLKRKVLGGWLGKKPDVTFYFDIDAETAYARKQEHNIETIDLTIESYKNLLKDRKEVVFVDAKAEKDDITRIMLEIINEGR